MHFSLQVIVRQCIWCLLLGTNLKCIVPYIFNSKWIRFVALPHCYLSFRCALQYHENEHSIHEGVPIVPREEFPLSSLQKHSHP